MKLVNHLNRGNVIQSIGLSGIGVGTGGGINKVMNKGGKNSVVNYSISKSVDKILRMNNIIKCLKVNGGMIATYCRRNDIDNSISMNKITKSDSCNSLATYCRMNGIDNSRGINNIAKFTPNGLTGIGTYC